jgi:hypothetical protein
MSFEKEGLTSKSIRYTTTTNESPNNYSNKYFDRKMAPAANESTNDAFIALNYDHHPETATGSLGSANFKDPLVIARAMIEHHRQQNDAEEKIAAIVRARQIEARKEQELDLARAIRRHHEDEQIQKRLFSIHREREFLKRDPELMAMAGEEASLRSETSSRKDLLLRSVLQRKQDEMSLLRSDEALFQMKVPRHQNILSPGGSRLMPLSNFETGLVSFPFLSQTSLSQQLPSSLTSRTASFLEDQASAVAGRLQGRTNSQFAQPDFRSDRSQVRLNSLYSSTPGTIPATQDIASLRKYYNGFTGSGNLDKMHANIPTPGTNLPSDWLRASAGAAIANAGLLSASSRQHAKHLLEGHDDLMISSKRLKTSDEVVGENDDNGSEQEGDQQQKRFNKHQCKQWTLKFHELLAFKEKMGHW